MPFKCMGHGHVLLSITVTLGLTEPVALSLFASAAAGDISPTRWATQIMLVVLLVLTFTALPYLTNGLMGALSSTSTYQRNRSAGLPPNFGPITRWHVPSHLMQQACIQQLCMPTVQPAAAGHVCTQWAQWASRVGAAPQHDALQCALCLPWSV